MPFSSMFMVPPQLGMEELSGGTRALYAILIDTNGEAMEGVQGTLTTAYVPTQLESGEYIIREARVETSDEDGRIAWTDLPIGAIVVVEIPRAGIARRVTIIDGGGDQQL